MLDKGLLCILVLSAEAACLGWRAESLYLTDVRVKQKENQMQLCWKSKMHLLLSRLGSPSRAAHPLARPGCQLLKKSPCREGESCCVTASPCSAWGRGRSISSSSPLLQLQLQQHSWLWHLRHAPPTPFSPQKRVGELFLAASVV